MLTFSSDAMSQPASLGSQQPAEYPTPTELLVVAGVNLTMAAGDGWRSWARGSGRHTSQYPGTPDQPSSGIFNLGDVNHFRSAPMIWRFRSQRIGFSSRPSPSAAAQPLKTCSFPLPMDVGQEAIDADLQTGRACGPRHTSAAELSGGERQRVSWHER
jgi:hypothetical protein